MSPCIILNQFSSLLRYSGDQEDKEWLAKNQLMSTTGGKAYLMVLEDILELAHSADMSSHPRHQVNCNQIRTCTVRYHLISKHSTPVKVNGSTNSRIWWWHSQVQTSSSLSLWPATQNNHPKSSLFLPLWRAWPRIRGPNVNTPVTVYKVPICPRGNLLY